jgi:hypothetical protein
VQAANEKPERPQEFEAKLEHEIGDHDQYPDEKKFHVQKRVAVFQINILRNTAFSD